MPLKRPDWWLGRVDQKPTRAQCFHAATDALVRGRIYVPSEMVLLENSSGRIGIDLAQVGLYIWNSEKFFASSVVRAKGRARLALIKNGKDIELEVSEHRSGGVTVVEELGEDEALTLVTLTFKGEAVDINLLPQTLLPERSALQL